ncbi:LOW QUALITY PROTEIN: GPI inositol-deacylase [Drosophila tropicalis]|uniref:LOW QUALITY PROTEIN: GPI inositol-deacylase n=1 Tax=Drosophila tropicalis TaxID=46794 RepID=UPI0035ABD306
MFMFRNCAVLVIIGSVFCFLIGILNLQVGVEKNACRMTYMFGEPMFARVRLQDKESELYPNYGFYYYYEGARQQPVDPLKKRMTGAPVIFVPGNAGSHKQVRSLASVALRKAMGSNAGIHLDYYTIDFDEELSAVYGGYLHRQHKFLKLCIRTIAKIYGSRIEEPSIIIIGHSMGGKLAQSMLTDSSIGQHINTIISISAPLDHPVLNLDEHLEQFYVSTNTILSQLRTKTLATTTTNVCNSLHQRPLSEQQRRNQESSARLDNVLLISTGGGNRDLLVRPGYTTSQFNDLHAMTSAIPRVSLSCDHLSAVWCLQFMQVINRFLFSIAQTRGDGTVHFNTNKERNLQSAMAHFIKPRSRHQNIVKLPRDSNWNEERRLVINKYFSNGLKAHFYDLISIKRPERYRKLSIEALSVDDDVHWLFGCAAEKLSNTEVVYCDKAIPLTHLVQRLPNGDQDSRNVALLDLHNLVKTYRNWTHILVSLPSSNRRIGYNLDIYDPKERHVDISLPKWYAFGQRTAINETLQGTLHYRLRISNLIEPYQSLRVLVEPLQCLKPEYRVTTRICVPWAAGFERYQTLISPSDKPGLYVNVPIIIPPHYNTTINPVIVDLYLDPICRYRISYEYSYADALSRLVLEFSGWLPAHLACVLLIVLRKQVETFQVQGSFKSLKPYIGYLQYTSLLVVTACRILKKLILNTRLLPEPENLDYSINISIVIHCTAIGLSILASLVTWLSLTLYGNAFYRVALRVTRLSQASSNIMISIMTYLPITYGVLTIAMTLSTCSGIGLLLAFVFYFIMLSNAYKDYLEDYLWQKAANLVHMATGTRTSDESESSEQENNENALEKDANEDGRVRTKTDDDTCVGLQNFPFHITLLLMLFMQLLLSAPATLAWLRRHHSVVDLPDASIYPTIIVLGSLSVLLQLRAPQKGCGYWALSIILYLISGIVLLYCQAAIYRLNYIFAGAFALLAAHQALSILFRR